MRHVNPESFSSSAPEFALTPPPGDGPVYPRLQGLDNWRRLANNAKGLTDVETRAYGAAVLKAINALNKPEGHRPLSLASTEWTPARQQALQRAELHRGGAADRARRTDGEIMDAYEQAMKEKRTALAAREEKSRCDKRTALYPTASTLEALLRGHRLAPAANANKSKSAVNIELSQAERARAWRQAWNLTRTQLAEISGFSQSQIQDYEEGGRRGKTGDAAVISDAAWLRYRLACAALAGKGRDFDWR